MEKIKQWAKKLKQNLLALYFAYQNKQTPLSAKILIFIVLSYALSPIDLIPDFIPILGYLDDIILIPLGISLSIKLIPKKIWEQAKEQAESSDIKKLPKSKLGAIFIILIWSLIVFIIIKKTFM